MDYATLSTPANDQVTSSDSGTGAVTSLDVVALTYAMPAGYSFTITGDTNTPPVVFTLAADANLADTSVLVVPVMVADDIAAGSFVADQINFLMNPAWLPKVHQVGQVWYPLGYPYAVVSSDGTKGVSGSLTVVATSHDMDLACQALFASTNVLKLSLPTGETYYIAWDPAADRQGNLPFSYMDNPDIPPVNTWTCGYVQVAAP